MKAPRAAVGERQSLGELLSQMIETCDDALMGDERFGEGQPRRVVQRGQERRARLLAYSECLVQSLEHGFSRVARMKPTLERGTRQVVELADTLQAEALQEPHDLIV